MQVGSCVLTCERSHACESLIIAVFWGKWIWLTLTEKRRRVKLYDQPFSNDDWDLIFYSFAKMS